MLITNTQVDGLLKQGLSWGGLSGNAFIPTNLDLSYILTKGGFKEKD